MNAPLQPTDERTLAAARWLASQVKPLSHAVPVLKERFQLSGLEACQAMALARDLPCRKANEPNQGDEA
ncbi:hypothetical protein NN6n1_36470 [Shinella zoogloeoides]